MRKLTITLDLLGQLLACTQGQKRFALAYPQEPLVLTDDQAKNFEALQAWFDMAGVSEDNSYDHHQWFHSCMCNLEWLACRLCEDSSAPTSFPTKDGRDGIREFWVWEPANGPWLFAGLLADAVAIYLDYPPSYPGAL